MPLAIAIVGTSGSGKTVVATSLVQRLAAKGFRIAAVKHAAHGHQVDRPGKDSDRLFQAGATRVIISSPGQRTSIERMEDDSPLEDVLASLDSAYDLVLAEGFKGSSVPKILVLGTDPIWPLPQKLNAVVSDGQRVEGVPWYNIKDMDGLARQIEARILAGC